MFSNQLFRNKLVNKLEINTDYNIRLCLIVKASHVCDASRIWVKPVRVQAPTSYLYLLCVYRVHAAHPAVGGVCSRGIHIIIGGTPKAFDNRSDMFTTGTFPEDVSSQ